MNIIYKYIANWLKNFSIDELDLVRNGRKCAVICAEKEREELSVALSEKCTVDLWLEDLGQREGVNEYDYYYIVIKLGEDSSLLSEFKEHGMKPWYDFLYVWHDITISAVTNFYRDIWNNEISTFSEQQNCRIRFKGWNSKFSIGRNVFISTGTEINIGTNSEVILDDNIFIEEGSTIRCEDNSKVQIGANGKFGRCQIVSRNSVDIGADFSSNDGLVIICEEATNIVIGNDVLVSSDVHMRSGNGHSLFDLHEKKNLSDSNKHIIIGNHVWIGQSSTILFNAVIGNGCVVGGVA